MLMFEYGAIATALRARALHNDNPDTNDCDADPKTRNTSELTLKLVRELLTETKATEPCFVRFWMHKYGFHIGKQHWKIAHESTKEQRLRLLHWKILHDIYPIDILLNKMKIKESNKCNCCEEINYLEHFFL